MLNVWLNKKDYHFVFKLTVGDRKIDAANTSSLSRLSIILACALASIVFGIVLGIAAFFIIKKSKDIFSKVYFHDFHN